MSKEHLSDGGHNGHSGPGTAGGALALLESRLAKATLFKDTNPYVQVVPTTSDPAPLGFFAFGFCGMLYMGMLAGWLPHEAAFITYAFFFTFGGIGMMIVGLLEYSRKNVFASNAFLCYSFFFMGTALKGTLIAAGIWKGSPKAEQMSFALWGIISVFFWVQTLVLNLALCLLFFFLSVLLFCLSAMETHPGITENTGGLGVFVCIIAFYNGAAALTREIYGQSLLPVVPFNWRAVGVRLGSANRKFGAVGTRRIEAVDAADVV